ncbi:ABC transporter ATP-binding protein [Clostridium ihumii]|uniref:ABC transporter ATP-binding protein n=1 Tax=Clostridium ihumii TaxID=1470356 RepID=UPI003D33645A
MMDNNKGISFFTILKKTIPLALFACPIYFIINNIVGIFHGMSFGVNTYVTQRFFDLTEREVRLGGSFSKILYGAIVLGIVLVISQVLNGVSNFMSNNMEKKMTGKFLKLINEKAGKLNQVDFENPKCLDDINKAKEGAKGSINLILVLSFILMCYFPYIIFMAIYLYRLKPILAISLVIIFIPVAFTQFVRVKIFGDLEDKSAPLRRQTEYYEGCIVGKEYYKETRILGAFNYFRKLYTDAVKLLNNNIWKAEKKAAIIELSMSILTFLGYAGVLYLLLDALMKKEISIGAFGAVFASVDMMFGMMEEIVYMHIGSITKEIGLVRNFIRFLDMPERCGEEIYTNGAIGIDIDNVSFQYPCANKKSLDSVNLKIKENETIAIVGENGAGKTTLVKLIMGIYMPTEGTVNIGNVDTKKASMKSLYKDISCVFQKYQRYKMTLKENVVIGYVDGDDKYIENNFDNSIYKSDLDVNKKSFPDGYETMLSREFDGVDLSGGQWQRVAIARGFYKNHKMIVLDEPTAAIDPVEETKIYKKFSEMAKGNTAIIVTHRLGSAKIADRIVVMDDGKISEIGSHEELMESNGKYREMYDAQRQWYVREEETV